MTIKGKAPLRISFGGGGTDIDSVFNIHGGTVISSTIDKYIFAEINKRDDKNIFINKKSLSDSDQFTKSVIKHFNPDFGFDFNYYNEVPPRRGLGSSSTYSVLLIRLMSELSGKTMDDYNLAEQAYGIESDAGICGWQDQFAASIGGFNYMQFAKDKKTVYPLRIKYSTISELESSLVLVYSGKDHDSYDVQKRKKSQSAYQIECMKSIAEAIKDDLLTGDIKHFGEMLKASWEIKKSYTPMTPKIETIYGSGISHGAVSGKLLGAGDGGYILFFVPIENRKNFNDKIGHDTLPFHFTDKGVETWIPRN